MYKKNIKIFLLTTIFFNQLLLDKSIAMDIEEDIANINTSISKIKEKCKNFHVFLPEEPFNFDPNTPQETIKQQRDAASRAVLDFYKKNKEIPMERIVKVGLSKEIVGEWIGVIYLYDHIEKRRLPMVWCSRKEWESLKNDELKDHINYLRWRAISDFLF